MKILIFSNEYPPHVGGAGIVAEQFMSAFGLQNHTKLITRKNLLGGPIDADNVIEVSNLGKFWLVSYLVRLFFFRFNKFDRIILNDFPAVVIAGILFSKKSLSKTIIVWHGTEDKDIFNTNNLLVKAFAVFYYRALNKSKKIFAVSKYLKDKLINSTDLSRIEHKIIVQYAGVDESIFKVLSSKERSGLRESRNFTSKDVVLLSISRVNVDKGYIEMYEVFKQLPEHFHWIVIGEGECKQWLIDRAREDGKSNNIRVLGRINREELYLYHNIADLFYLVTSETWHEAFGLVYVEAALSGLFSIVRKKDEDGTNESVKETGFFAKNNAEVLDYLKGGRYLDIDRYQCREVSLQFGMRKILNSISDNVV